MYTNMRKFMMNDDALAFSVLDPKNIWDCFKGQAREV